MIEHPKILCLFSAPLVAQDGKPLGALDIGAERDAITHELSTCKKAVSLRIGHATVDELARSIAEQFNILHLSCHGQEEYLLFEDGKGGSQPIPGDYLKRLLSMGGPFELAIVSACHSERIGELMVEAGIRHVIAIKWDVPVLDIAAIAFIGQFFRSLFQGDSVQKAFEMAKLLVEGNPELMKLKPQLEFIARKNGVPFVPEEKKFVLLPEHSNIHLNPLLSHEVLQGTLVLEEPVLPQSNLPVKPHSFTGRSVDMYDIVNELCENRFVTITGVGGIGKTVVAIEVARWFCARSFFPDGIFCIDLRQTDTVEGIVDVFGAALGVRLSELKDVIVHLRDRHCLLLLDNAEDILWQDEDAMQDFIDSIFKFTPNTKLLVTSQRPVGGNLYEPEHVYRLYPLERDDAAILFLMTARRRMEREEWESQMFCSLLEQLGGHPLSIVLTACQLTPGIVLEDLTERITVYRARAISVKDITDRDAEHGESLVASLASAYDTLSENAKTLFGILSILPAGAQEEMLTNIYGGTAWSCVQELNKASLVEIRERRATLLPPVRLFALSVTAEGVRDVYGPKIMEFLGEYTKRLYVHHSAGDAKEYRLRFTLDEPNLRSAVDLPCQPPRTAEEHSALGVLGPRLVCLYSRHLRWKEAKEVGKKILSNLRKLHDQLGEADTLLVMGALAMKLGELEEARSKYKTALIIYQNIGYNRGEANTLWELGNLIMQLNDFEEARSKYKKALMIYENIDEKLGQANTFGHLGDLAVQTNDFEEARSKYETALAIYQSIGDKLSEAYMIIRLGQWAVLADRLDQAETYLDNASTLCEEIEDLEVQADAHMVKALVFLKHHEIVKARKELDYCSSIQDKARAHYKTSQWLTLYAVHLRSHDFQEGAKICLEYAEKSASKTRNQHLQR